MIQVGRLVDEFRISEPKEKQSNAKPVIETYGDADRRQNEQDKMGVHERLRPGPDPSESWVRKVEGGKDVQVLDPAFWQEARHGRSQQQPKENPERREGSDIDWRLEEPLGRMYGVQNHEWTRINTNKVASYMRSDRHEIHRLKTVVKAF